MSAVKQMADTETVPVLWMDDEPNAIVDWIDVLNAEPGPIRFDLDVATSIDNARLKLRAREYGALVVDCKMNPNNESANGAEFLLSVNEARKSLPTFVYSAWLDDPLYQRFLGRSLAVLIERKQVFDPPLSEKAMFSQIYEIARKYLAVKHLSPEIIQFKEYEKNPAKHAEEVKAHWMKHGHWIQAEMRNRHIAWCVVCEEQIVRGTGDLFQFPNTDGLVEIGKAYNRIPFAYSKTLLPESVVPMGEGWARNDYYPAIRAKVNGVEILDDFDTGAPQTYVSDGLVKRGWLSFMRDSEVGYVLGSSFNFFTTKVKITLFDADGSEHTQEIPVAVVEGWDSSAFKHVNSKRVVLFGRDLLRAFEVEVTLDSKNRVTRVRFI